MPPSSSFAAPVSVVASVAFPLLAAARVAAVLVAPSWVVASATAAAAQEPEAGPDAATVRAEPARLVAGQGVLARLFAAAPRASGEPRWFTQLGTIVDGLYDAGDRRAPGFAIVAVAIPLADGREARGAATIALVGRGALPTTTAPGASVTVEIAGRSFGPVIADARGRADVPVEVPPGVTTATVHSVDRYRRKTAREIELPRPPYPLALAVGPVRLRGGERTTVTVFAIAPDGRWRTEATTRVRARAEGDSIRVGAVRSVAPGRWEIDVEGKAAPVAASGRVVVAVDDEELPAVTFPIEPATPGGLSPGAARLLDAHSPVVGLRAGGATAFGELASLVAAADLAWPLWRGGPCRPRFGDVGCIVLSVGAEVGVARGTSDEDVARRTHARLTQAYLAGAARLRWLASARVALDGIAGVGPSFGEARVTTRVPGPDPDTVEDVSRLAPLFFVGAGCAVALGPGEFRFDLRYADARYDEAVGLRGNTMGLVVAVGYGLRP